MLVVLHHSKSTRNPYIESFNNRDLRESEDQAVEERSRARMADVGSLVPKRINPAAIWLYYRTALLTSSLHPNVVYHRTKVAVYRVEAIKRECRRCGLGYEAPALGSPTRSCPKVILKFGILIRRRDLHTLDGRLTVGISTEVKGYDVRLSRNRVKRLADAPKADAV